MKNAVTWHAFSHLQNHITALFNITLKNNPAYAGLFFPLFFLKNQFIRTEIRSSVNNPDTHCNQAGTGESKST